MSKNLSDNMLGDAIGLLYEQTTIALLGTLISAGVLAFVQFGVIDHQVVIAWLGAAVAVSLSRYLLLVGYRRSQAREAHPLFWRNLFFVGAMAAALVWGSSSALLFAPASIASQTFLAFVLAGISAGATPVLAPSLITAVAFLSVSLLPLAARFLLQDSEIQLAMGGMMIVFFLYLISVVKKVHGTIFTSLALRHANLYLVEGLASEKNRAESANRKLQSEMQEREEIQLQLKRAKEEAEQASKSKGDFLATISHEIRTPMNGVLGALELVKDMPLGKAQRELLDTAYGSAESLIGIINNVLDFSKIEVGRLELEAIEFDLRRLVAEVTSLLGKRAQDKGLKVAYRISGSTPDTLRGDPTRLRQILNNLVGNAVKFTEQGKIEVRVDVARSTPSGVMLRFEVEDTGIGISPVAQASLFQPFTQADSSMARKYGGTGLGLSITRQLVGLMDGRIGVQSEVGKGSTFWFTLHLAKRAPAVRAHRSDLRGALLLVSTADQGLRDQLDVDFRRWGASVEFTATALETMEKLRSSALIGHSWSYNAVIMDAASDPSRLLPLASEIRSDKRLTGTVLVVIGINPGDLEPLETMVDACVPTPLGAQALFDALAGLIEEAPASDIFGMAAKASSSQVEPIMLAPSKRSMDADTATSVPAKPILAALQGHLLLVEDNPVNQKVAKSVVERLGLSVDLADDGFQAVEALTNGAYDVVLMDCQMPGMDGLQATEAVRRIENDQHRKRVPIIAVTANAMEGDRERCLLSGMDDYLAKPFKQTTLRDMLIKWLPEEAANNPATPAARAPVESEQTRDFDTVAGQAGGSGHILVADDDAVNRKMVRALLKRLGYSADLATNGREAIAAMETGRYDAILMDCEMPEVDGFAATREIRRVNQQRGARRMPILALTGHIEKSDRERCLQAGMDDVVTKPIKRDALDQALRRYLSRAQRNSEAKVMPEKSALTDNVPALDSAILAEMKDIMEDEFDDLVQAFLNDAPVRIYAIRDGIQASDAEAVRVAAHTLKSSAANLGALSLSAQAKELELLARKGTLTGSVGLLKQMAEEFKRARNELRAL